MNTYRQWTQALAGLALAAGSVMAQDPAVVDGSLASPGLAGGSSLNSPGRTTIEADAPADPVRYLFPQDGRFRVRGWLDAGDVYNSTNPASKFNGPYNAVDRTKEVMFNQAYLITEVVLPQDGSFGVGGRVDLLYGEDYILAQALGLEVHPDGTRRWNSSQYYGLALPQLYGEIGTNDLSLKIGKFYSIVGYEGVMAPENFFYSKAYPYQFAGPFTHFGGLVTAKLTDTVTAQVGLVNGWNAIDRTTDRLGVLAGLKYQSEPMWTSFAIITGDEPNNVAGLPGIIPQSANRTRYSYLLGLKPTAELEYVFHHWLGFQEDGTASGSTAWWYGIDQYLYYRLTDQVRLGGRFEWFRDEEGTRVGLNRPANPNVPPFPGNFYSLSAGINYLPVPNLVLRPEIRSDWYTGNASRLPYQDGNKDYQLMLGFDAILRF